MQGLIRLLSTCASGSALGAKTLLLLGISGILKDILSGSGVSTNASVSPALNRPQEQVGYANFPGDHYAVCIVSFSPCRQLSLFPCVFHLICNLIVRK